MKRTTIPIALLILIAIASIGPSGTPVTANQQGPGVGDQLTGWAILCDMHGGKATVDTSDRTSRGLTNGSVSCSGGLLDGLLCSLYENPSLSLCVHGRVNPENPGPLGSTGIDAGSLPIVASIPIPTEVATPASDEIPSILDAQVAWPATEGAMQGVEVAQIHACTLGGGKATATTRLPDIESAATVRCNGGFLDAYTCDFVVGLVTCFTDAPTAPDVQPTTAPQGPDTSMPETPQATSESTESTNPTEPAMPTEPTVPMPTTVPTDEPVIEPTAPPATESDPRTVPEGTLQAFEPAEPTPTEVILT